MGESPICFSILWWKLGQAAQPAQFARPSTTTQGMPSARFTWSPTSPRLLVRSRCVDASRRAALGIIFRTQNLRTATTPKWRLALSSSELRQWVKSYKTMRWSGWYSRCLNNGSSLYVHSSNLADHVHQTTNSNRKHPPDSVAGMGCVDAWERTSLSWTSPAEKLSRWRHRCRADARTGQNWGSGWEDVSERKSENCRLQKPLNMGIFNIFHRIDDDKRCILWVNVPRNPWQFGTGATQRLGQAQALRKFLRTGGVASGSWNPWNYQGWWMQMAMGRSPWQSSRWISPDDMSVFFPKKHVEELIW